MKSRGGLFSVSMGAIVGHARCRIQSRRPRLAGTTPYRYLATAPRSAVAAAL